MKRNTVFKPYKRKLDPLGRLVIPKEYLAESGIEPGDKMLISVVNGELHIIPDKIVCVVCSRSSDQLLSTGVGNVCQDCKDIINGLGKVRVNYNE